MTETEPFQKQARIAHHQGKWHYWGKENEIVKEFTLHPGYQIFKKTKCLSTNELGLSQSGAI